MTKIIIDEEDIFNFVFFPNSLTQEKFKFIESHRSRFARDIEFCKKLQEDLDTSITDSFKEKIGERINTQTRKIFHLSPVQLPASLKPGFNTLAAASEQPSSRFFTFKDDNDKVLVRLLSNANKQELFLFSQEFIAGEKIRLTFLPGKESSEFILEKQGLTVKLPDTIEEILIESV
jgi:hypothetical protein